MYRQNRILTPAIVSCESDALDNATNEAGISVLLWVVWLGIKTGSDHTSSLTVKRCLGEEVMAMCAVDRFQQVGSIASYYPFDCMAMY
uniref:Uncharacterized protein n=1 Tax=Timema douglasi TaxID=61478 RepID=A0A7R8VGU5_TIMDO|nr:unnamed protein product [Timema douglasi]